MDKTNLSSYVFIDDKRNFEMIVLQERQKDRKRTVGDVFHEMLKAYQEKKAKAVRQ
jgi:hypothetical protein